LMPPRQDKSEHRAHRTLTLIGVQSGAGRGQKGRKTPFYEEKNGGTRQADGRAADSQRRISLCQSVVGEKNRDDIRKCLQFPCEFGTLMRSSNLLTAPGNPGWVGIVPGIASRRHQGSARGRFMWSSECVLARAKYMRARK
jgi:hypothetical protein